MIIQKISYTNLDDVECTEAFAFNLSQQDFVRLELRYQPGIEAAYEKMVAEGNLEAAYDLLTDLIESSYGVRMGSAFVKNRRINGRDTHPDLANFKFQPAFEQLMIDLMSSTDTLLHFFRNLTNVKMTDEEFKRMAASLKKEVEEVEIKVDDVTGVETILEP